MPSAEPIKLYLEALEEYSQGNREAAAQKLAESFGAREPSAVMVNLIDQMLSSNTMANDIALRIISSEVSKRETEERDGGKAS